MGLVTSAKFVPACNKIEFNIGILFKLI